MSTTEKLQLEQVLDFARIAFEEIDEFQCARVMDRWELLCEEKGWSSPTPTPAVLRRAAQ
jgi:hypothetical protein